MNRFFRIDMRVLVRLRNTLKRLQIRRLYNRGWMDAAREHGLKEIDRQNSNREFAQDIVIRCYFNQCDWESVIDFADQNQDFDSMDYVTRARRKIISDVSYVGPEPALHKEKVWNGDNLLMNWYQEDQRLWLRHPWGWVYWDMPQKFELEDTAPSLLHLALEVLLSPWIPETKYWEVPAREPGTELALSYSGGIDSTAAALLLPVDTFLAYHQRDFESMLDHSIPKNTFQVIWEKMGREVLCVPSNHERIRLFHDLSVGFSTANAAGVHLILLADHLKLRGIAFGTPIDNTWLKSGRVYRDFSKSHYWKYWSGQFSKAGLSYVLPINHISEAGALEICRQSSIADAVNSCLRGKAGIWCGECWKCFHKNGPLGRKISPNSKEINTFLTTKPLRTAQHALWALQVQGLEDLAPHLRQYISGDLSWWAKAYRPGLDLIPEPWNIHVETKTLEFLGWMDPPLSLEAVNLDF